MCNATFGKILRHGCMVKMRIEKGWFETPCLLFLSYSLFHTWRGAFGTGVSTNRHVIRSCGEGDRVLYSPCFFPPRPMPHLSSAIESLVSSKSLLNHAFYKAWSKGELTLKDLQGYAKEYYYAAKNVPVVMETIRKNAPHTLTALQRETFEKNAAEEVEHIELWERFASSLGITQDELNAYEPTEIVREAVTSIVEQAELGFEEGVAAMYAFECELPAISQSKIDGLQKFYGLTSQDAHAYFNEHMAEEKHLCFWRALLDSFEEGKEEECLLAAESTVAAQNRILDGVIERYIPTMCSSCA